MTLSSLIRCVLTALLTACGSSGAAQALEFGAELGSTRLHARALSDLVDGFFGVSGSLDLRGSDTSNTGRLGVEVQPQLAFSLQASAEYPLSSSWETALDASLSVGRGSYYLPEGAAPFRDPITLRFTYLTVQPRAGLRWSYDPTSDASLYVQFGAGYETGYVQTTLRSLLLDVRDEGIKGAGFVYAETAWAVGRDQTTRAELGISYTEDRTFGLTLGYSFPLP